MSILLPAFAVASAAFCVWLTVRIVNRRKKRGVAFWATVVLVALLVAYPLSFGPACWATAQAGPLVNPPRGWMFIYLPLSLYIRQKKPENCALARWVRLGLPRGDCVALPFKYNPLLWYTVRNSDGG